MEGDRQEQEQSQVTGKISTGGLRPIPIIIANEVSERIVSSSVTANLIIYLTTKYHLGAASSAIIIFTYQAAANFLPFCGAIVSDALLGRYLMITLTLLSCTIGTTLLCLTSAIPSLTPPDCTLPKQGCPSPTHVQLLVLCTSLGLMSLGASGVRPCCLAFAEDQIAHWDAARKDRVLRALFSWYYVSVGFSQIVAVTVLVYLQDKMGWKVGFTVSAAMMASVTLLNFAASPFYVKVKPQKSMWVSMLQVAVVAIKNRDLVLPEAGHGVHFHSLPGSTQLVPSQKMRFLNKACLVRTQQAGGSTRDVGADNTISSWNTCTVEQVENFKAALSVVPMWSAMVMPFLMQSSSFGVLQADTMDRRVGTTRFQIPSGSISIFEIMAFTAWSGCYDPYILPALRRVTGRRRVLTLKQRMGIGVLLAVASTAVAAAVETRRREGAAAHRRMSALWLAPQYALSGLSGAFGAVAQIEFYYAVLPKSMGSLVLALLFLGAGVASVASTVIVKLVNVATAGGGGGAAAPWLADDLDRGRYDRYYLLLAVLGAVDLVYFVVCCYVFDETTQNRSLEASGNEEEMVEYPG
ncbi:hypothetical protein ACP70R_000058 [Stipagrostis hirtigluma subsp. patula]